MFMPQSGVPGYSTPGQVQMPLVDGSVAPIGAVYYHPDSGDESEEGVVARQPTANDTCRVGYGGTQVSETPPPKSNTFLAFAIVGCLFNLPLGIAAIAYSICSQTAYNRGDYVTARKKGQTALGLAIVGMILSGVVVATVLLTGGLGNGHL